MFDFEAWVHPGYCFFLDVSAKGYTAQEAAAEAGKARVVLVFP